jgi:hypothetical protein
MLKLPGASPAASHCVIAVAGASVVLTRVSGSSPSESLSCSMTSSARVLDEASTSSQRLTGSIQT